MVDLVSLLSTGNSCLELSQVKALACQLQLPQCDMGTTDHSTLGSCFSLSLICLLSSASFLKSIVLVKIKIRMSVHISGVLVCDLLTLYSPGWPQTCYVAKDNLGLLILLP